MQRQSIRFRFPIFQMLTLGCSMFLALWQVEAHAFATIQDVEVETIMRKLAAPVFEAAGVPQDSIEVHIINDTQINAFVAGGNQMFFNTGLLTLSDDPEMFVGVLAHELGHITGGHLLKTEAAMGQATLTASLGYILGIGAAAMGAGDAATAILLGGSHIAERQMLKYSRENEETADQSAVEFLAKTGHSVSGLLALLEHLNGEEIRLYGEMNPYVLTHPLTHERISHLREYQKSEKSSKQGTISQADRNAYREAMTKLYAFLYPVGEVYAKYPVTDQSVDGYYARSVAYFRESKMKESIAAIDHLIALRPTSAYFHELRGQILFENGKIDEALKSYKKADQLMPHQSLIEIQVARCYITLGGNKRLDDAEKILERITSSHPDDVFAWHQLAIAYGKNQKMGYSNLALAQKSHLIGDIKQAKIFVKKAMDALPKSSPAYLRASDLSASLEREKENKKD